MANTVLYDDSVIYDALDVTFDGEDLSRTTTVTLGGRPRAASAATHAASNAAALRAPARVAGVGTKSSTATVAPRGSSRLATATQKTASTTVSLRASGSGAVVGVALQLQVASPVADLADGSWTNELSSTTDLYASIDESTPSDADYIQSSLSPLVVDEVKLILAALDDPTVDTDHVLRYRYAKDNPGGDQIDLVVRLYAADGSTVIAEQTHTDIDAVTDGVLTLSEAEAATIPAADYSAGLVLGFRAVKG